MTQETNDNPPPPRLPYNNIFSNDIIIDIDDSRLDIPQNSNDFSCNE